MRYEFERGCFGVPEVDQYSRFLRRVVATVRAVIAAIGEFTHPKFPKFAES